MEQNVIDILEAQFNTLPESIQHFIVSNDFTNAVKKISENRNLNSTTLLSLENETLMVLMGLEPLSDLEKNLISEGGINQEQARTIVDDVFQQIITPVENELRTFLEKELLEEESLSDDSGGEGVLGEESGGNSDTEDIKKVLRENSKTVNVKNLIANLK